MPKKFSIGKKLSAQGRVFQQPSGSQNTDTAVRDPHLPLSKPVSDLCSWSLLFLICKIQVTASTPLVVMRLNETISRKHLFNYKVSSYA